MILSISALGSVDKMVEKMTHIIEDGDRTC